MTNSATPDDLAVTFRSLARRQREALGDAEPGSVSDLVAELDGHVAAAATTLGSAPDAEAVASAIGTRRPEAWDDATLGELRRHALAAGAVLRSIAARTGAAD